MACFGEAPWLSCSHRCLAARKLSKPGLDVRWKITCWLDSLKSSSTPR
jgi:hypothetical protein